MTAISGRAREPLEDNLELNALIRRLAGARRTVVLEPDFEGVAGFAASKPERAWSRLADARLDDCLSLSFGP